MSAFIVEDATISKIVTFINGWCDADWYRSSFEKAGVDHHDPEAFGTALAQMNQDAVCQRYQDEPAELTYRYQPVLASKVAVYKAIQCLSYQCAEGNVPERPLYQLLEKLEACLAGDIIRELPEYDKAVWG
jgi:hypothetical protein